MPLDQDSAGQACYEVRVAASAPRCLLCGGGDLVPVRGAWRCTRCGHALCAGCEPGGATGPADCAD
jgi:hypothetical protein